MNGPGEITAFAASEYADRTALITRTKTLTYRELDELSNRLACALRCRGIEAGDRVAIYSQNRWEWIVTYHGILKVGAIVNPINVMLTPDELGFVLEDCGASMLFAAADKLTGLENLGANIPSLRAIVGFDPSPVASADFSELIAIMAEPFTPYVADRLAPSTIGYTSGTTGRPKGAVQSQQAVLLNCKAVAAMHGRSEKDVVVSALPAPHVYGNVVINSTFLVGGTVVLMERFDAREALDLIEEHGATLFEGVPAMYGMLLADPTCVTRDFSSITRSTVGGQAISVAVMQAWQQLTGAPLIELWGMTELSGLGTTHWHDRPGPQGSIGMPLDGIELKIADIRDSTKTMPVCEPGELLVRGPLVMIEYFGNPEATAEAIDTEGWLHTGDVAYVDETGHFFVVDRLKDMIITAGYNVYPAEIERVIAGHPDVALVAVGAVTDDLKGELAKAYIVVKDGAETTAEDVLAYCRGRLAPYKMPRKVGFVAALPQTSTGKIMRRKLADLDAVVSTTLVETT